MKKFLVVVSEDVTVTYAAVEVEAENEAEAEAIAEEMRVQGQLGDAQETVEDINFDIEEG